MNTKSDNIFSNNFPVETTDGRPARLLAVIEGIPAPLVVEVDGRMENYNRWGNHMYDSKMDLKHADMFGFYDIHEEKRLLKKQVSEKQIRDQLKRAFK